MTTSSRTCRQCGEAIFPGQSSCPNCGAPSVEESSQLEQNQLASSAPNNVDTYDAAAQPAQPAPPSSPYGPAPSEHVAYDSPFVDKTAPTASASGEQVPQSGAYPPLPPPVVSYGRSHDGYGPHMQPAGVGKMTTPRARKRSNLVVSIIVVFLLLVLIGTGSFFVTRFITGRPTVATASTPAVVLPTQIATQSQTTALFSDNFSNNDNDWDTTSGSGYLRTISNNELTLADSNHKILIETLPVNNTYADMMFTISFTLIQADQNDSVGLYIRGDSNLDHDYRLDLFGDNSYALSKEYLDGTTVKIKPMVDPTNTSALNPMGQQNTVSLIAKGSTLVLVINNKTVSTITDTDYTNGQVALFVQNGDSSKGVKVMFSNVSIYPAPQQLPG